MRIVIVGSFNHWNALEKHFEKHLTPLVDKISLYPFPDYVSNHYSKSLLHKALYRYKINTYPVIKKLNYDLFNFVMKNRPDIVWVFKGINIIPEILLKIKNEGIKLVNYNPDHPFIRTFRSSGGNEIEDCVPIYDLHFCYSRDLAKEIKLRYDNVETTFLPFGYELSTNQFNSLKEKANQEGYINRISFIGNPDNEFRYHLLSKIINNGIPIDVFGTGWNKYFGSKKQNLKIFDGVYNEEYWSTLMRYNVQLNIFRPHNVNSHNMRTFEIPAVGSIQVAPLSDEHQEFFEEGKSIFLYKSENEMIEKIGTILSMNSNVISDLREVTRLDCLSGHHTYQDRAKIVFNSFENLLLKNTK
jgi:spore maturation protein CgeB